VETSKQPGRTVIAHYNSFFESNGIIASPWYDKTLSGKTVNSIAQEMLSSPFEVEQRTITLLRTIVESTTPSP